MTAAREAVVLPLLFLTILLFGGFEPGASRPWTPPSVFSLVLAVMTVAVLVRGGALAPERLLHSSRSILANSNGAMVLFALLAGSAQLLHMLTPRSGLPSLIAGLVLFLLLLNTLVAMPDRRRLLRSLAVVVGSAFVLKFVILAALSDPDGGRTRRVLVALFDAATLGTVSQEPLHPSAGYIAFLLVLLYLAGIAALPGRLPGIPHPGRYPVDGDPQRGPDLLVGRRPHAPEQLDLEQVDRIDVRVADVDRPAQHRVRLEQPGVPSDGEHGVDGAPEPPAQGGPERPERR